MPKVPLIARVAPEKAHDAPQELAFQNLAMDGRVGRVDGSDHGDAT